MNLSEITVKKKETNELVTRIFEDEEGIKEITSDDYIVEVKENRWIPVEERMPEEHDSVFAKYKGTIKWLPGMFEKCSDEVEVTFKLTNDAAEEKRIVRTSHTNDGKWSIEKELGFFDEKVVAWRTLREPYQGEEKTK